jgi:Zn-finger nucleic acid-binding protein
MLNCPKCVGKLEEKIIENLKVDVCWVCEGIWFDKGELEKVLRSDSKDFDNIDLDRDFLDGNESIGVADELNLRTGPCPRCSKPMEQRAYENNNKVMIDVCPDGCGIWLDSGEIHKLRDRREVEAHNKRQAKKNMLNELFQSIHRKLFKKNNRPT